MINSILHPHMIFAAQRMPGGLSNWDVSRIEEATNAIEGWKAISFECECCGKTTALVVSTCEVAEDPTFELSRDDGRILLTTTWLDGEDYDAEFWSLPAALGAMRATIATATDASGCEMALWRV
jgi:hypothetical protein